jgi:hypothetical protein
MLFLSSQPRPRGDVASELLLLELHARGDSRKCRPTPEEEARIATGVTLALRDEITIFETSEPPGQWRFEPRDYQVLWWGCIEGGTPPPGR